MVHNHNIPVPVIAPHLLQASLVYEVARQLKVSRMTVYRDFNIVVPPMMKPPGEAPLHIHT